MPYGTLVCLVPASICSPSTPLLTPSFACSTCADENLNYFPLTDDPLGWNDKSAGENGVGAYNFFFTLECKSEFTYRGGEFYEFQGDDDLWIFINNRLVIDLGGVHGQVYGRTEYVYLSEASEVDIPRQMSGAVRSGVVHSPPHPTHPTSPPALALRPVSTAWA